jgi:hypothetical protein
LLPFFDNSGRKESVFVQVFLLPLFRNVRVTAKLRKFSILQRLLGGADNTSSNMTNAG